MEHWLSWFVRLLHLSSCFFVGELRQCYADLLTSFILTMIKENPGWGPYLDLVVVSFP